MSSKIQGYPHSIHLQYANDDLLLAAIKSMSPSRTILRISVLCILQHCTGLLGLNNTDM